MRNHTIGLAVLAILGGWISAALAVPDYWDPRLNQICDLQLVDVASQVPAGQGYWRLTDARFENETEAGGNHTIFYKCLDASGNAIENQKIFMSWPYGNTAIDESLCVGGNWSCAMTKGSVDGYWGNSPLAGGTCPSDSCKWPYNAFISQTSSPKGYVGLSDKVIGMGMTNPQGTPCHAHVDFRLTWRWTVTPGVTQYKLAYWYEVGYEQNANNHSVYVHVFDASGNKLGNKRVEDLNNPGSIFGITNNDPNDKFGFCEIALTSDVAGLRVNDSGIPSDVTPPMVEHRNPNYGHYSWECGFMLVPQGTDLSFDQSLVGTPNLSGSALTDLNAAFTRSCAYYDVNPLNFDSDQYSLDSSANTFGQTFVANGNRVMIAKFQPTVGFLLDLRYGVQIRQNGPGGAAVGPRAISRLMKSDEYYTQTVQWPTSGANSVPVVSGNTYYAEITRADQTGTLNLWKRNNDLYPSGQMFRSDSAVSGRDLIGRVVCGTLNQGPSVPTICYAPPSFTHTVTQGKNPPDDVLEVWNCGGGTLNYVISDNADWLSEAPFAGGSTGEHDFIPIQYATAALAVGTYQAMIQITDPNATNNPQSIPVSLTVEAPKMPGDFDLDNDVDQEDFGYMQACLTGPGLPQNAPNCQTAKLDADSDVDEDDIALFLQCMTGANRPGDVHCAG